DCVPLLGTAQEIIGRYRLMVSGRHQDGTAGMTLQTTRAWLALKDLVTGTPNDFLRTVAQHTLSRSVPEHDALRLVKGIHPIRGLCEHCQHLIHCLSLPPVPSRCSYNSTCSKRRAICTLLYIQGNGGSRQTP